MHKLLPCRGGERFGNLPRDAQSGAKGHRTEPRHVRLGRLTVNELHCIEELLLVLCEVINRSNVAMSQPRGRASFPKEPVPVDLIGHEIRVDHFQSNRTLQIRIQSFVGDAHGATPEFPERAVIALQHAVVFECNPVIHTYSCSWNS